MAVVRKFLFDNDFGAPETPAAGATSAPAGKGADKAVGAPLSRPEPQRPAPPPEPMFSEAEMQGACDVARRQGEEAGVIRGKAEAVAAFDKQVAATLAGIVQQTAAIAKSTADQAEAAGKSLDVAMAVVKKLFPALAARNGIAEIEEILTHCLASLKQEPRLVAYVSTAQLDALQGRLAELTAANGFEGRVVLIGDDKMADSDCRVEWADGGVERDSNQIWRTIEDAINRYLAAEGREQE
ncbi:MAG TPA: FliH/SctL family protein [Dongiaceae bacterium]|nr:FliH/SctL family protein [Dongiaceae bacterium]